MRPVLIQRVQKRGLRRTGIVLQLGRCAPFRHRVGIRERSRQILRPSHGQAGLKTLVVGICLIDVQVVADISPILERRVIHRSYEAGNILVIGGKRGGKCRAELMRDAHLVFRRPLGIEIRLAEDRLVDVDVILRIFIQALVVGILKEMSVREVECRPVAYRVGDAETRTPLCLSLRGDDRCGVERVAPEGRPLIGIIEPEPEADDERAHFDLVLDVGRPLDRVFVEIRDIRSDPLGIVDVEIGKVVFLEVETRAYLVIAPDLPGEVSPDVERLRPVIGDFNRIRQGIELGPQPGVPEVLPAPRGEILRGILVDPRIVRLVKIRQPHVVEKIRKNRVCDSEESLPALFPDLQVLIADVFPALIVRPVVVRAVPPRQGCLKPGNECSADFPDEGECPVVAEGEPASPGVPFAACKEVQVITRNRAADQCRDPVLPVLIVRTDAEFTRAAFEQPCKVLPPLLRHDVDNSAERIPVLGIERPVEKHQLRNGFVVDPRPRSPQDRVLDVHAVDEIGNFVRAAPPHIEVPAVSHHTRLHLEHLHEVLHRHHLDLFAVDDGDCGRRVLLYHRPLGLDHHLRQSHRCNLELRVKCRRLVGHDPHTLDQRGAVAHERHPQIVRSRRDVQYDIGPVGARRRPERRADEGHVCTDK